MSFRKNTCYLCINRMISVPNSAVLMFTLLLCSIVGVENRLKLEELLAWLQLRPLHPLEPTPNHHQSSQRVKSTCHTCLGPLLGSLFIGLQDDWLWLLLFSVLGHNFDRYFWLLPEQDMIQAAGLSQATKVSSMIRECLIILTHCQVAWASGMVRKRPVVPNHYTIPRSRK